MRSGLLLMMAGAVGLVAALALSGCSGTTQQARTSMSTSGQGSSPSIAGGRGATTQARAAAEAKAEEVEYAGWTALKLSNGLVTVIAVPDAGGRILEYNLGAHPFLWVNAGERGKTPPAPRTEAERRWVNFGGYKAWPGPQSAWGGPPDPLGSQLDSGRWQGKVVTASGPTAVIEMISPADGAVTGLQITRRVSLAAGSTRLTVTESFHNVGKRNVTWSARGVTQVAAGVDGDGKPDGSARVYVPLNPSSRHRGGYVVHSGGEGTGLRPVGSANVLEASYTGQTARIGVDSQAGWLASVDDRHGVTLAQTFQAESGGEYPDGGSTVQVNAPGNAPYLEIEARSPAKTLAPGDKLTFTQDWYAARVGGPIIKVTAAGAVKTHPTAARKGDEFVVTGEVGVFAPGEITLEFMDADGKKLGASPPVSVTPADAVRLDMTVKPPAGTRTAMVMLSAAGRAVGNVAQVPLVSGTTRAQAR